MSIIEETLSQSMTEDMIMNVQDKLEKIFQGRSREVSYQDLYHILYCLFQSEKGKLIEQITLNKLQSIFESELASINPQNCFLEQLTRKLIQFLSCIQKMMKVYFSIDIYYFKAQGKGSLRQHTYQILKQVLVGHKQLFNKFINELAVLAFSIKNKETKDHGLFRQAIQVIGKIDSIPGLHNIFSMHFAPRYVAMLSNVNGRLIPEFRGQPRDLFFQIYQAYKNEKHFLDEYFQGFCSQQICKSILKCFYSSCVTVNLKRFLSLPNIDQVFEANLKILYTLAKLDDEVFKDFSNFYIERLNQKFDKLNMTKCIFKQFSNLYNKTIGEISDFDITLVSRVKMNFELWLNKQANTVNRLNIYISKLLDNINSHKQNSPQSALTDFMVIFKFIKDKDMFEKGYRKLLVERIVSGIIDKHFEMLIINMMKEQCGSQWTKNIEGLLDQYYAQPWVCPSHTKIFSEQNWPFQENFKAVISSDLLNLKTQIAKYYHLMHSNRLLRWHPILGDGIVCIRTNTGNHNIKATTAMINFLLYFNAHSEFKLTKFLQENHLNFDLMKKHIYSLYKSGVVCFSEPVASLVKLNESAHVKLNLQFAGAEQIKLLNEDETLDLVKKEELSIDRKVMVDGIIIRYLKERKFSSEHALFEQICRIIEKKGFSPKLKFIEECLTDLTARYFIRRGDNDSYVYIP